MYYKRKRIKGFYFLIIFFILFISILKFDFWLFKSEIREINQNIESFNTGFSSTKAFLNKDHIFINIKNLLNSINGIEDRNYIGEIKININNNNFLKILEDRKNALKNKILENPEFVNGTIIFNQKKYKADIRLKGDLNDHWASKKRMSFRIRLKNGESIFGFNQFSLHKPSSRFYPFDQAFQTMLINNNYLGQGSSFVHIYVNGIYWGVMNFEEHISKELLEKQKRKESLVFKFGNDYKWVYEVKNSNVLDNYLLSEPKLYQHIFQEEKYLKSDYFRKVYSYIINNFERNNYANIFDLDNISQFYFMHMIWGNLHGLKFFNARYYFNPFTLKLEQISNDVNDPKLFFPQKVPYIYQKILEENNILSFTKNKNQSIEIFKNFESYLSKTLNYFPNDKLDFNFETIKTNIKYVKDLDFYSFKNSINLKDNTKKEDINRYFNLPKYMIIKHYTDGQLKIINLLPFPIKIYKILYNNKEVSFEPLIIDSSTTSEIKEKTLKTDYLGIQDKKFKVFATFNGKSIIQDNNYSIYKNYQNPLLQKFDKPDYIMKYNNSWIIKKGTWEVTEPIIINGDLIIEKGTKLLFNENSYLIVNGSITALGTSKDQIFLTSLNNIWRGIYVYLSNKSSNFNYVNIENISSINIGPLNLTGGINFYKSNVKIRNSNFSNNFQEDFINFIDSNFEIKDSYFNNIFSDAVDSDFSNGKILNTHFKNIGGDAIDYSGSDSSIKNVFIEYTKDKGISVGEKSNVDIVSSQINNSKIGVVSKDGSKVYIIDTNFQNNEIFDIMTYQKKSFYDYPFMSMDKNTNNKIKYLRQKGSKLFIDNELMNEKKFDINTIY